MNDGLSGQSQIANCKSQIPLEPFCLLADPHRYIPCEWDLSADADTRGYWVDMFQRHFRTILKFGIEMIAARNGELTDAHARADRAAAELDARLNEFIAEPKSFSRVTILTLDDWRDGTLARHGFVDPFLDLKNRENERTLPLLPVVCRQIDSLTDPAEQFLAIIEGLFAGNIFDMGAEATARAFLGQSPDFFATRKHLPHRPWLIDDYDAFARRMLGRPRHRKCVFFIDNAGSDFLLGALTMMRWLAMRGTDVILAANERPTLNDMTIHDVRAAWPRIVAAEPSLKDLPIAAVSTGTGEPLIDLGGVSREVNAAANGADLLILEGMGRGVESNVDAEFICDAAKLAMIKDPSVAKRHGGKVFDVVCRYQSARSASPVR